MKSTFIFLTITFLFITNTYVYSQDFSNKGKDFWVVYSGHVDGTSSRMALYITSDQDANGVVEVNGSQIPFSVAANSVKTVQLTSTSSPSNSLAYNAQVEGIGVKKGIHITADKPVVVYSHILNAARSGSTLVLPTNVLGKEYYVSSYKSTSPGPTRRSQFDIIATLDNTTVEITPTQNDGNGTHSANVPFQITLSKGDVYQYQSDEDLTGTHVRSIGTATASCQPIAVFSGSTFTAMGCSGAGSGDNLYQQLFPFASWGKVYYTAPFKSRAYDIFRIIVQDPAEPVYVNGTALASSSLISGRYYEFNTLGNNTPKIITSNKPICVFQYIITMGCDGSNAGDPEMIVLNAVEQTLNDITVMSARKDLTPPNTNITSHYLNIIFKTNTFGSLKIDGASPLSVPIAIPGTNYSYIQEDVTNSTNANPAHHITSDSGFICIAYGYGNVESYGYNAGTNVKDLYQFVTLQNQYAITNFPATCKNTPFYFSITLPYQPTSLNWDFNNNPNLTPNAPVTNSSPVADSNFVRDGKTLYVYKLPAIYTFSTIGTYPIKVIANNPTPDGCSGTQEINYDLIVYDPPTTDFTLGSNGCLSDSVRLTDISNSNPRPIIKWMWSLGDNTSDSVKNPIKKYNAAGTYNVKLQIITDVGCIADTTKSIAITPQPVAKFGISPTTCIGKSITFTDSSTVAEGNIIKWTWNFGDGTTPVVTNSNTPVTHAFASTGKYLASLEVETSTGCKSILLTKVVTVYPGPAVDFTFGNICLPAGLANFTNLSSISDGTENGFSYAWDFGDGGTSVLRNPTHQYASMGPFYAKLTVTSVNGCVKDTTKPVNTIYAQPKSNFGVNAQVCLGDTSSFKDQSSAVGTTVTQWRWNFGDGTADTTQNPRHLFTSSKTDSVKLFVLTDKGCVSDTIVKAIVVNPLPVADFITSAPACETKQITVTDKSIANAGSINSWIWNFGDSTFATYTTSNPFTKTYITTGTYIIKVAVLTDKGCRSDTSKTVTIHPQPVANIILPKVCLNDAFAQFTDSSYISDGSASSFSYSWNFGDVNAIAGNSNTSTLKNPIHKYSAVGVYNISLTVTSKDGCSSTITKSFTVNGSVPVSNFMVLNSNALCSNTKVEIQNTSTVDFGSITKVQILWDVNGAPTVMDTDDNPAPGKIYANAYPSLQATKAYQIKFRTYSGGSCVNESVQTITVNASPVVSFVPIPTICMEAPSQQISQASETGGVPGTGAFSGKGISSSGLFNPKASGSGTFPIQYLYTSTAGCKDSAVQNIIVWPTPTVNLGPDIVVLEGGSAVLNANVTGNSLSYLWSPSTYLDTITIKTPRTTPLSDITYTLTVTAQGNCTNSDNISVRVLKAPSVPNAFSPNGDGINDVWNIKYLDTYPNATIQVFNRYGQLVYEATGYSKPWDGTTNGKPLPVATYYYIINPKNGRKQMAGSVTILR
jgi:gliding motility-associated-like protein